MILAIAREQRGERRPIMRISRIDLLGACLVAIGMEGEIRHFKLLVLQDRHAGAVFVLVWRW